jgi:hypothetical protein
VVVAADRGLIFLPRRVVDLAVVKTGKSRGRRDGRSRPIGLGAVPESGNLKIA